MNNTYFGAIHYDIPLDMKLDYTISRVFQEMSLTELETLHQLCKLKMPYAGYSLSGNRSNFIDYEEIYYGITPVPKKYHLYMCLKIKDAIKESQYSTKIKYILLIHSPAELSFGIQQSHVDHKEATM